MNKQRPWQVRVVIKQEAWVTIYAETAEKAAEEARNRPNVLSVQPSMTLPGDRLASDPVQGLEDD